MSMDMATTTEREVTSTMMGISMARKRHMTTITTMIMITITETKMVTVTRTVQEAEDTVTRMAR
jgi:hypothetical protein